MRRAGFTLVEILVVIIVIAMLATLVAPSVFQHVDEAKASTAKAQIEMLSAALDAYRLDNDRYPTSEQGLAALRHALEVRDLLAHMARSIQEICVALHLP